MAGDWIKMRTNLWDDPRVMAVCDLTGETEATIVGGFYWLWATADSHTEDGLLPRLSLSAIDRKTGIKGFSAALCEIGWLTETEAGIEIINFSEHNGTTAKKRAQGAKRTAKKRTATPACNAGCVTPALQERDTSVTGALPREEKRREEKKETKKKNTKKKIESDSIIVEEIRLAYPKRVAKPEAVRAIRKALDSIPAERLLEHVQEFSRVTAGANLQFIPNPATWFNQERWTDDREIWRTMGRDSRAGPRNDSGQRHNPNQPIDPDF